MGEVRDKIDGIFALPLELMAPRKALREAIVANEEPIKDLNRQQLDRGRDSEGKSLGRYARFAYKQRWQPVDLLLTGAFRDKMGLQVDDKQTEIFSQDEKSPWLEKRYGKDIFGVAAPFIPTMAGIVKRDFLDKAKKQIIK